VVEGEPDPRELSRREPPGLRRVVAPLYPASDPAGFVENRDVVTARIAVRSGIDAEELSDTNAKPSLLEGLTRATRFGRLLPLAEASRQSPASLEGGTSALDEEEPPLGVDHEGIDGQTRVLQALVWVGQFVSSLRRATLTRIFVVSSVSKYSVTSRIFPSRILKTWQ
jgi:hypothetical protein